MRLLIVGFLLIASVGCAVGETTTIYDAESAVFRTLFTRDLQSTPSSPVTRARRTAGPGDSCTVPTQDKDCTHEYLCVNGTCTTCLGDDQCDSLEQCSSGKCLHKGFFSPFTWHEALGTIISFVGASLAAGGGLGGGGLFVPILVLIVGLAPTSAVAISQGMIFGGSIVNLIFNIRRKHPISKHRPLIDFDAVLMLEPALLAGTVIGVLLNSIFPEWLIVSLLAITLVIMTWRTVQKARQVWAIESQQRVGAGRNVMELEDVSTDQTDLAGGDDEEVAAFLDAEEKSPATSPSSGRRDKTDSLRVKAARRAQAGPRSITDDDDDDTDLELSKASSENGEAGGGGGAGSISAANMALIEAIKKRESRVGRPMLFIMLIWLVVSLFSILKGGRSGTSSIVGVTACSPAYWALTFCVFPILIGMTAMYGRQMMAENDVKQRCGYEPSEGDIVWTRRNAYLYPSLATFAGLLGGLLGIGGGMIVGPLLLELGMLPTTTSATSAMTVMITSSSAVVQYIVVNQLIYDYAVWFFFVGVIATIVGQKGIDYLVRRYDRRSFVVISIAIVIAAACVMMSVTGIMRIVSDVTSGASLSFRQLC